MKSNFLARLKDPLGRVVEERRGHNVITDNGREWLSYLMAWRTIDTTDVKFTDWRVRWIGVGEGSNLLTSAVEALHTPLPITTGPDIYLGELDAPPTFPTVTGVRFSRTFAPAELGAVTVTEAGLFAGTSDSQGVSGSDASIVDWGGWTVVTGLENQMHPQMEGKYIVIGSGDNIGTWEILKYIDDSTVRIDVPAPTHPDTGNPNIDWQVKTETGDSNNKPVAYKTFEGLVKIPGFSLEIEWDFRF